MTIPNFTLRDLTPSNLARINIFDKSAERSYGRRFELIEYCLDGTKKHSSDLVFKDIFHKVDKLARKAISEDDIENLWKISDFLEEMKTVESHAAEDYAERDCFYRFRTWFHRLFTFGSHQDKILKLLNKIHKCIDNSPLEQLLITSDKSSRDQAFDLAKQITNVEKKDRYLDQLATAYQNLFYANMDDFAPLEQWVEVAKEASQDRKDSFLIEIARIYMSIDNYAKASEVVDLLTDDPRKTSLQQNLADLMSIQDPSESSSDEDSDDLMTIPTPIVPTPQDPVDATPYQVALQSIDNDQPIDWDQFKEITDVDQYTVFCKLIDKKRFADAALAIPYAPDYSRDMMSSVLKNKQAENVS